jgi:phosphate transport system protein
MSHYEERLERDLNALRSRIAGMSEQVQRGLDNAVLALQKGDHQLAGSTILADHPINRTMREVDAACHAFIAVHLPSGMHLRLLSSVIRVNIALERMGDYAVTIARAAEQLSEPPSGHMALELERFGDEVRVMVGQAITAFNDLNVELARGSMVLEQGLEFDLDGIYAELMANPEHSQAKSLLTTFTVFTHLKRAADQAKNLCEDTVFAVTGETKVPKVYNILFIDGDNACASQMAEALARKSFPGSGSYSSAGARPAGGVDPATAVFLEDLGVDIATAAPNPIEFTEHQLAELHLVVSLQGAVRDYLPQLPFHTSGLEWDIGASSAAEGESPDEESLRGMYRELGSHISELMQLLRGQDAP